VAGTDDTLRRSTTLVGISPIIRRLTLTGVASRRATAHRPFSYSELHSVDGIVPVGRQHTKEDVVVCVGPGNFEPVSDEFQEFPDLVVWDLAHRACGNQRAAAHKYAVAGILRVLGVETHLESRSGRVVQNLIRAFGFLQESWGSRFRAPDDESAVSEACSLHLK
jgi:hypothetical protein